MAFSGIGDLAIASVLSIQVSLHSPGYISPQQAKVDAAAKFVRPVQKKDIRSFLGLAGYYIKVRILLSVVLPHLKSRRTAVVS